MQPTAEPMVHADGLSKRYGRRCAVDGLTFAVEAGQVCALLGPNGAGKTSTMRMPVGLSTPDAGHARILGEPTDLGADVLRRVGVLIDGPALDLAGLRPAIARRIKAERPVRLRTR